MALTTTKKVLCLLLCALLLIAMVPSSVFADDDGKTAGDATAVSGDEVQIQAVSSENTDENDDVSGEASIGEYPEENGGDHGPASADDRIGEDGIDPGESTGGSDQPLENGEPLTGVDGSVPTTTVPAAGQYNRQEEPEEDGELTVYVTFCCDGIDPVGMPLTAGEAIGTRLPIPPDRGAAYLFEGWFDEDGHYVDAGTVVRSPIIATARYRYLPSGSDHAKASGGIVVTASWDEGVFPEGTKLSLDNRGKDYALSMGKAVLSEKETAVDGIAVDITFLCDGVSVQPYKGKTVRIDIRFGRRLDGDHFYVLHEKGGSEKSPSFVSGNRVETVSASVGAASAGFDGKSFSVYGVIGADYDDDVEHYARNIYKFYAGDPDLPCADWKQAAELIYRDGDTVTVPDAPPAGDGRHPFLGWFIADGKNGNLIAEIKTGDTVSIDPATAEDGASEDHTYYVYAKFGRLYACTFYTDSTIQTIYASYLREAGESVTLPDPYASDHLMQIESGKAFVGWKKYGDPDTAVLSGTEIMMEEEDLELVPVLVNAHTVHFELVLEEFEDQTITDQIVADGKTARRPVGFTEGSVYRNQKLIGWYQSYDPETGEYSQLFDFDAPLTAEDPSIVYLYAKWEVQEVSLTVIPYLEKQFEVAYQPITGDAITLNALFGTPIPIEEILETFKNDKYQSTESGVGYCHWSGTGILDDDETNGILIDGRILPAIQVLNPDGTVQAEYDVKEGKWLNDKEGTFGSEGTTVRVNYNRNRYYLHFLFGEEFGDPETSETILGVTGSRTLNEDGKAVAPEGYTDVVLPTIVVKYAQHIYKVTHLIYTSYGDMFDAFMKKSPWGFKKYFGPKGSQTVFDETHPNVPIRPDNPVDGTDVLLLATYMNAQKLYTVIFRHYDQEYDLEDVINGSISGEHYKEEVLSYLYDSTGRVRIDGVYYGVGRPETYSIQTADTIPENQGSYLAAITNHYGVRFNGAYDFSGEPCTTPGDYSIYAKNGYATENGSEPAEPIIFHHFPVKFTVTFKETKDGTVLGGFLVDNPRASVSQEVYNGNSLADILTQLEPQGWEELTDVRGVKYVAMPGWKGDVDEEGNFPETMPSRNLVFYKEWTPIRYTAVFHFNIGEEDPEQDVYLEQEVYLNGRIETVLAPSKEGKIFGGWYEDKDCTKPYDFTTTLNEDELRRLVAEDGKIHLYAKWNQLGLYSVRYDPGEGVLTNALAAQLDENGKDTDAYYGNANAIVKGVAEKDGMVFIGWKIGSSDVLLQGGQTFLADSVADKADGDEDLVITLVAQYAEYRETTTVTYHSNFPDGTAEKEDFTVNGLVINGKYDIPYNASDLGFTPGNNRWEFVYWTNAEGERIYTGNGDYFSKGETVAVGISDNDLYAVWRYRINYKDIPVTKNWDDMGNLDRSRPENVTVVLLADGKEIPWLAPLVLSEKNNWSGSFTNIPDADAFGNAITYTAVETPVPTGYTCVVTGSYVDGFTVKNSHEPETTTITVKKVWDDDNDRDGKRSGVTATVTLYKTVDGVTEKAESVTVGYTDDWSHIWTNLPVYDNFNSITYSVVETLNTPNGYTSNTTEPVEVVNGGEITITNSHEPETTTITVKKVWRDNNDSAAKRRTVIAKMYLQRTVDGKSEVVGEETVGYEDDWVYTWTDLPVYDNGKPVTYGVREVLEKSSGYRSNTRRWTTVANGGTLTVTNTLRDSTPGTGDNTRITLWIACLLVSAAGLGGVIWILVRRKKRIKQ